MSGVRTVQTNLTADNVQPMMIAADILKMEPPVRGRQRAYSGEIVADALRIKPKGWPHYGYIDIDLKDGNAITDEDWMRGSGGTSFDRWVQQTMIESNRLKFTNAGYTPTEHVLADGTIELRVEIGGGVSADGAKKSGGKVALD